MQSVDFGRLTVSSAGVNSLLPVSSQQSVIPQKADLTRIKSDSRSLLTNDLKVVRVATFTLGYSHPIEFILPKGVDLKIDKQTHLVLTGSDREEIGQVAALMRSLRPPDPYKNKGVRYMNEVLRKKAGKTGAGAK